MEASRRELAAVGEQEEVLGGAGQDRAGAEGPVEVVGAQFDAAEIGSEELERTGSDLLQEEAHVGRVIDPAGGSWYVERRTADLAERAWAWFQEIETAGGTFYVDGASILYLIGSTMDWVEDDFTAGFVFQNPNAKGSCGCGESFTV